ncbi:MAG: branched-chain amino acid ABC transporter permease [Chloroflexi bacterium]|nr:branched-chain amino acid ABC transporter permease [Chloroflexota bacterium]
MIKSKYALWALALLALVLPPFVIKSPYVIHILILTGLYIGLAYSYNLIIGEIGILSLAHPVFFGIGGYVAALMSTRIPGGASLLAEWAVALVFCSALAFAVGILFFRLASGAFAIATLAFGLIAELIIRNWVTLTNGPMCIVPIPRPRLSLAFLPTLHIRSLTQFYWLVLVMTLLVLAFCYRMVRSRIGRSFLAIRENETLASSLGINPLKYKMLALVAGAGLAGVIGATYAHYMQIICPTDMSFAVTTILLIIVYVGGAGSLRGIILGGFLFTALPELLRAAPQYRLFTYGIILLSTAIFMPEGLEGIIQRLTSRRKPSAGQCPVDPPAQQV